jgi:protein TonB
MTEAAASGLDFSALRPGAGRSWPARTAQGRGSWLGAFAISLGFHAAAFASLLVWPAPSQPEADQEVIPIEIVLEAPATAPPPATDLASASPPLQGQEPSEAAASAEAARAPRELAIAAAPIEAAVAAPPEPSPATQQSAEAVVAAPPAAQRETVEAELTPSLPEVEPAPTASPPAAAAPTPPAADAAPAHPPSAPQESSAAPLPVSQVPPGVAEASPASPPSLAAPRRIAEAEPTADLPAPEPAPSAAAPPALPRRAVIRPFPPVIAAPLRPAQARPQRAKIESRRVASLEAVAPREPSPINSGAVFADYRRAVAARLSAVKRYPEAARERAPQGVAIVSFSIGESGQVARVALSRSAGDVALDAEALATVRRASPFPPPPVGGPRVFSAPLSFKVR